MLVNMKLSELLKFVEFTHKYQNTFRAIPVAKLNKLETDVEHSYQLALLSWYIIEHEKLSLNRELAIKYAMVHDLAEIYAGDRHIFDTKGRKGKDQREHKALLKIFKQFPDWKDLPKLLENYQKLVDRESKFVYALDKLIPLLNIYIDGGRTFKKDKSSLGMLVDNKKPKVVLDPTVDNLFWQWARAADRKRNTLFIASQRKKYKFDVK